jgi:hypothetical protein
LGGRIAEADEGVLPAGNDRATAASTASAGEKRHVCTIVKNANKAAVSLYDKEAAPKGMKRVTVMMAMATPTTCKAIPPAHPPQKKMPRYTK